MSDRSSGQFPPEHDDERLRALVRDADPAASLPPADPARVARLLETTMSPDHDPLTETRQDGTRNRSALTWLVAAAALVVIGGAATFVLTTGDDTDSVPTAQESIEPSGEVAPVTTLAASAPEGRCGVPTAAMLAQQDLAFQGTVQEVDEDVVVLVPSVFYAGEPTELVEVQGPPQELQAMLQAVTFEEGETYLVSASDGQVSLCGLSGVESPELQALYVEAFAQ